MFSSNGTYLPLLTQELSRKSTECSCLAHTKLQWPHGLYTFAAKIRSYKANVKSLTFFLTGSPFFCMCAVNVCEEGKYTFSPKVNSNLYILLVLYIAILPLECILQHRQHRGFDGVSLN